MATSPKYGELLVPTNVVPNTLYNASTTTRTGFLEFKPRDMETQKKYDAMSPAWEGVDSSMKAVQEGLYTLNSAETTDRTARPVYTPGDRGIPTAVSSRSVVQTVDAFFKRQPTPDGLVPGTCVIQ
jgi:hypothetical protein